MIVLNARNVNQALAAGLKLMQDRSNTSMEDTRNGPVVSSVYPVTTMTAEPLARVLFSPLRNANPFFHLFESLWMLAGRNDLPWLAQFNKRMTEFSDDNGATQPGAYGYRWRVHFGYDQLEAVIDELTARPNSRRAVLAMWDPWGIHQSENGEYLMNGDLLGGAHSKDVPCNTHIYFRIFGGALGMTVCCRSNDLWWGAHGANAVHFSVLLEYMAARLGLRVGAMWQVSNNYHVYTNVVKDLGAAAADAIVSDLYTNERGMGRTPTRMFYASTMDMFRYELPVFMEYADPATYPRYPAPMLEHWFLSNVALPMLRAWQAYKAGDISAALQTANFIGAPFAGPADNNSDWRTACLHWLSRKQHKMEN